MMKSLRYFLMSMFVMLCGSAMAADVVIDFNAMDLPMSWAASEGVEASEAGDIVEAKTITQDGVTVVISPKEEGNKNANRFWKTNNGPQLRCYSGTITVKYTAAMKSITFDAPSKFNLTAATGAIDGKTWSGEATEVVFTVAGNSQINKITISTDGGSVTPDPQPTEETVTVAQALEIINGLSDGAKTDKDYIVKGYVVSVTEISAQYGNATFTIADQKGGEPVLTIFRVKGFNGESITDENLLKAGDLVEVQGKLQKYVKNDVTTPELAQGGKILSINGNTGSGDTPTPQPEVKKITVAEALTIIDALEAKAITTEIYEIEGFVVSLDEEFNPQYGNYTANIGDTKDATATLKVYRAKNADNEKFVNDVVSVGSKILVQGKLQKYVKGEEVIPETSSAIILKVDGVSTSGITTVKMVTNSGAIYTLSGQRVEKATKGLFIRDGKKYMVK
jgi:RPA family protein